MSFQLKETLNARNIHPALPSWMPRLAFAPQGQAPRGDVLVCIFQRGAMDGLNAVVPVGDSEYYRVRKAIAIAEPNTNDAKRAIGLDSFFALHPALAGLKPAWDEHTLAIVHAVGSPDPTRSHFDAMQYMEAGTPGSKTTTTGWIGRHLQTLNNGNTSPVRAVGMGNIMQASLRGPVPATVLQSIADFHLRGKPEAVQQIQQTLYSLYTAPSQSEPTLKQAAIDIDRTIKLLSKIDVTTYAPANGAQYPKGEFAMALQQVAQLIKADVGLEVACIDVGGWDTHANEGGAEGQMARLLQDLGDTLGAFYMDLRERMNNVLVVTMSEFGRRVAENAAGGTDHGHANCMFLMGGQVNGGRVHAQWPGLAKDNLHEGLDLKLTTDYRDVLGEILTRRLRNNALAQVFPNYTPVVRNVVKA
jgi:uncharacterized protein (DUF1501 family)